MLKHHLANVTWRCQNLCSYCWLTPSIRQRPGMVGAREGSLDDWARSIRRDCVDVVEVAGGEPLLIPWLGQLFTECPETRFGLSTNGRDLVALERVIAGRHRNLIAVNLSCHPESAGGQRAFGAAARLLARSGNGPHSNIVNAPGIEAQTGWAKALLKELGIPYEVSPYETVDEGAVTTEVGLCCRGGIGHLTVAPDGSAWPCLTTIRGPRWRETCLGNWFEGAVDIARKPEPCYLNCVDYFVLPEQHAAGDMWGIGAYPCGGDACAC